jgi:hypothetical protein
VVKGYQRRVVFLKNTGSPLFEEALFIMRSDGAAEEKSDADMASEADRIIKETFIKGKRKRKIKHFSLIISFASGALLTLIIALICF